MSKLLSIMIPTFNRSTRLKLLIDHLVSQIISNKISDEIQINIVDNCSNDETNTYVQQISHLDFISYIKNETNIGGINNIIKCLSISDGAFTWVIGDDDYVNDNALLEILAHLNDKNDAILMNFDWFVGLPNNIIIHNYLPLNQNTHGDALELLTQIPGLGFNFCQISAFIYRTSILKTLQLNEYAYSIYPHTGLIFNGFMDKPATVLATNCFRYRNEGWRNNTGVNEDNVHANIESYFGILRMFDGLIQRGKIKPETLNKLTLRADADLNRFISLLDAQTEFGLRAIILKQNGLMPNIYNELNEFSYLFLGLTNNKFNRIREIGLSMYFMKMALLNS